MERDSSHYPSARHRSRRRLALVLLLTALYAVVEVGGGMWAGSLVLLADAGHMVTDVAALGLAIFAKTISRRPASARNAYAYARAEILGTLLNALLMLAMVGWIVFEAIGRLMHPVVVNGTGVTAIAGLGLAVNLLSAWLLAGDSYNMNSRSALLHVLSDLLGSLIAVVAGLIVWLTGWFTIDALLSFPIAVLIFRATWFSVLQSSNTLLDGASAHLDLAAIGHSLLLQPGIVSVRDMRTWHIGSQRIALSAHIEIKDIESWPRLLAAVQSMLAKEYGVDHVTLQPIWTAATFRHKSAAMAPEPEHDAQRDISSSSAPQAFIDDGRSPSAK